VLKSQYRVQKQSKIDLICEGLIPFFRTQLERTGSTNRDTITDFVYSCLEASNIQPNTRKGYVSTLCNFSLLHDNRPFKEMKKDDVLKFLIKYKKPESEDPLHKWIGTYNLYVILIGKFFKWINKPECVQDIKQYKRKEKSVYKPSDLWTAENDLLFLKYCPFKRDKCRGAL
jgi:site-specific recombinase XerD